MGIEINGVDYVYTLWTCRIFCIMSCALAVFGFICIWVRGLRRVFTWMSLMQFPCGLLVTVLYHVMATNTWGLSEDVGAGSGYVLFTMGWVTMFLLGIFAAWARFGQLDFILTTQEKVIWKEKITSGGGITASSRVYDQHAASDSGESSDAAYMQHS